MLPRSLLILLLFFHLSCQATEYQSRDEFLAEAFSGQPPKAKSFWISKDLKASVAEILQHRPGFLRTRYWQEEQQSVWILEEIGKTKQITVGVIIYNHQITRLKVLAFRESRGWEVKHAFFTDQFKQASLDQDLSLSQAIDGISGATLSVRALNKIARLALLFDRHL